MRKYQKVRLIKLANELEKIHELILYSPSENLIKCQELAITIGEIFETEYGIGNNTTKVLEDYCEHVYSLSIKDSLVKEDCKILQNIFDIVKKNINDIAVNYVILFLPYKSSMWDSFNSVYKAAKKEENCDVHVVPIPYYSLNKNHDGLEMYYEYQSYQDIGIPIDSYQEYDISKERPDVIFIHNPYDDANRITQVPEKYFSRELCQYTDHLVYIPYYLLNGTEIPDDLILLPAVKNSWKTIVQSEEIKKQYLKYFSDEKIIALGSPKIDAVMNCTYSTPIKWQEKIKDKKIILLNIHLRSILNKEVDFIKKITYIISISKQMGWVVLWRPHPLTINTIKNVRPDQYNDYLSLEAKYEKDSNVIIDRTSNLARAINISDVYVGDESSVVALYEYTGKPIYITDIIFNEYLYGEKISKDVIEENILEIFPQASTETEKSIWYIYFNNLFEYDKSEKKINLRFCLESDGWKHSKLQKIFVYCKKIFCVSFECNEVIVFNLKDSTSHSYFYHKNMENKIAQIYHFSHYIYIVCSEIKKPILRINMEAERFEYYPNWNNEVVNVLKSNSIMDACFNPQGCIEGGYLVLPVKKTNLIIITSLNDINDIRKLELNKDVQLRTISSYKGKLICTEFDSKNIWIIDIVTLELKMVELEDKWNSNLGSMFEVNNSVWFMENRTGNVWSVSLENYRMRQIKYSKKDDVVLNYEIINDSKIWIHTLSGTWILNSTQNKIERIKVDISLDDFKLMIENNKYLYYKMIKKYPISIWAMDHLLFKYFDLQMYKKGKKHNIGENIWKSISEEIGVEHDDKRLSM